MFNRLMKLGLATALSAMTLNLQAAGSHSHDHHDHAHHDHEQKAHVHGISQLQIALEGQTLEMAFESPADNIVGFEHVAKTDTQIQAVKNAKQTLSQIGTVWKFSGTSCTLVSSEIDVKGLLAKHDYDKKHNHDHHHKHDDHQEISAYYKFKCDDLKQLSAIETGLFKAFPRIEKINGEWVSEYKQGLSVLTASNNILVFSK